MAIAEHVRDELGAADCRSSPSADPPPAAHAEHRRGLPAALRAGRADRGGPRLRADRVLLRARDARARSATPSPARSRRSTWTGCVGAPASTWAAARASSAAPQSRRAAGRAPRTRRREPGRVPTWSIVGGGPAGLAAAVELRARGVGEVRGDRARGRGGRHPAPRPPPGLRAARPAPRHGRARATRAATPSWPRAPGPSCVTETMVTGWTPDGALELTGPAGRDDAEPRRAVVLATGCRERPARRGWCPGRRPAGVMTTGMLQQLVYLHGRARRPPRARRRRRARELLRVGDARPRRRSRRRRWSPSCRGTSRSAAFRARRARCATGCPCGRARRSARSAGARASRRSSCTRPRHAAHVRSVECDTVVFTADWIPDHELAVLAGVELDPGTRGPAVDAGAAHLAPGRVRRRQRHPWRRDRPTWPR